MYVLKYPVAIDKQAGLSEEERLKAEGQFKEIGEAYEVLSDERKKHLYDNGMDLDGGHGHGGHGGGGMDDFMQAFFQQQQSGFGHGFGNGGFGHGGGMGHGGFHHSHGGYYEEEEN